MSRSWAILGTGAVGGYYGALLQTAGLPVHFLLHSEYDHVSRHGLRVDSPRGNIVLPKVHAYARPADMPPCDVVAIAWKTTANAHLAEALPPVVKPGGVVLVLQNGLDPEREAAPHVDGASLLSGLCFLSSRRAGPGHILHQDYGSITLADFGDGTGPRGVTGAMREVAEDLGTAGVETRLMDNWRAARWRKLMWNVPFNGLCALTGLDTRALLAVPGHRARLEGLMAEVMAGAALEGCALPADFVARMLKDTEAMVPYAPSMRLDREAGRPMELDAIYRRPIAAIRKGGGRAPLMEGLLLELESLQG